MADTRADIAPGSAVSARAAAFVLAALESVTRAIAAEESRLGAIDAVAGDGDHGAGMVSGIRAAREAAREAVWRGVGAGTTLHRAGSSGPTRPAARPAPCGAAASRPPATSSVTPTRRRTRTSSRRSAPSQSRSCAAVAPQWVTRRWSTPSSRSPGELAAGLSRGLTAAERTADYPASRGRSRTHGERSVGTLDPDAVSFALMAASVPPDCFPPARRLAATGPVQ